MQIHKMAIPCNRSRRQTGRRQSTAPSDPGSGAARAAEGDDVDMSAYREFTGKSVEEALKNGREALKATIAALKTKGHPIPAANAGGVASGKFVARVPKTVHAQLTMFMMRSTPRMAMLI